MEWKGEPFVVEPRQIARVEYKTQRDVEWPYESDMAIVRTNGVILDGRVTAVAADGVTVSFPQGGGGALHTAGASGTIAGSPCPRA